MDQTHRVGDKPVALVLCGECGCEFYVYAASEHQPKFCSYCGRRFGFYEDTNNVPRNLSGQEIDDPCT